MLLPEEENCANDIEPPNDLDIEHAFTRKMDNLFSVMKAIHKFKALVPKTISAITTPTSEITSPGLDEVVNKELTADDEKKDEKNNDDFDPAEEIARAKEIEALLQQRRERTLHQSEDDVGKGQAKEVGDEEPMVLGIGTGIHDTDARDGNTPNVVADSPTAVDFNIYDRAYEDAINERLKANPSERPVMYLTKYVKETEYFQKLVDLVDGTMFSPENIMEQMKDTREQLYSHFTSVNTSSLANLVGQIGLSDSPVKTNPSGHVDINELKKKVLQLKDEISKPGDKTGAEKDNNQAGDEANKEK